MRERTVSMAAVVFDFFDERKHHNVPKRTFVLSELRSHVRSINMNGMTRVTDREHRDAAAGRLKAARIAHGLSNGDLARLLKVRPGRITSWEDGTALPNTPRLWDELCDALDITTDFVLRGVTSGLSRVMYAKLKQPPREGRNGLDAS
jgi:DNA-binding transcriptional regulator YiaG